MGTGSSIIPCMSLAQRRIATSKINSSIEQSVSQSWSEREKRLAIMHCPSCIAKRDGEEAHHGFSEVIIPLFLFLSYTVERGLAPSLHLPSSASSRNDNMAKESEGVKMGLAVCLLRISFFCFCFHCEGTTPAQGKGIIM